ncbi:MAG: hypothetical protein LUQ39_05265 [Methanomassiliicoccales archaeon]|nr:hypothetical protein [Methanomassiliicoccales archaeon]
MPRSSKARTTDEEQVRQALQKLQDGYLKRNPASLDYYMKELFPSDGHVTIIGTSGLLPEDTEWPRHSGGARKLLENDWRNWGDVYFNVAIAKIRVAGDVAWVESNGFVEKVMPDEQVCENHLKYVKAVVDGDLSAKEKVAEIARGASNVVMELMMGERYVWPMRFSAVLQRSEGRWAFRLMHFSFPTTRFPDERLVGMEAPGKEKV